MRLRNVISGLCAGLAAALLAPAEAAAQTIPPTAERSTGWDDVSNVSMVLGATTVFLMPRVYYSDPAATVGWKGRWHVSMLAPAMTLTVATLLVELPIKYGAESVRPGCTLDATLVRFAGSNCETFGGPSTQAFASWGTTGAGTAIFLVDTFKYSSGKFSVGSFIGNVGVPLAASVVTTIGRAAEPGTAFPYENGGQILAGALPGFFSGLLIGFTYSQLQRPNCGYGDTIICW